MNIVLDLTVVLIVAIMIFSGYRRGLLNSVIDFAGVIVSAVASSFLASMAAISVYEKFIMNKVIESVQNIFLAFPSHMTADQQAEKLFSALPDYAVNALSFSGIDVNTLSEKISTENIAVPQLVESLIRPTAVRLVSTIITVVLFIILTALIAFLAKFLTKAVNAIGLSVVNRIGGAIFGLVKAIVLIMVLTLVLYFIMMFLSPDTVNEINDAIEKSYLYNGIYKLNLLNKILALFGVSG
ncbi:MAG: CvpA family protein [Clostridia bacterium]|nr:CvpA family protein [Clostridia bacterium]